MKLLQSLALLHSITLVPCELLTVSIYADTVEELQELVNTTPLDFGYHLSLKTVLEGELRVLGIAQILDINEMQSLSENRSELGTQCMQRWDVLDSNVDEFPERNAAFPRVSFVASTCTLKVVHIYCDAFETNGKSELALVLRDASSDFGLEDFVHLALELEGNF
ncbi:hypothetical protein BKA61DRAFT_672789 [Leptodontidium sp. MPI-SDFR-AT-0119]|nr:hypothetical protein BKA61DRAFT_672789 [Leptodontidium sp. MPI-SDFR-AT-0119]